MEKMKWALLLLLAGCGPTPGRWTAAPETCTLDIEFPEPGVCGADLRLGDCVYSFEPVSMLSCWVERLR